MVKGIGEGLPGGPVVKNPPCNAGDVGSIPGQGTKILHAMEQLIPPQLQSPCVTVKDPTCRNQEFMCHNYRSCMPQWRQRIPRAATKMQCSQIDKYTFFLINKRRRGNRSSPAWLLGIKEQSKITRGEGSKVLYMCIYIRTYPFIINLNFRIYSKGTQQEYGRKLCRKLCVCVCVCARARARVCTLAKSCSTLCDPMDCSLPGSSLLGIFPARILEWVAISKGSAWPRDWTHVSCISCIGRQILYHWATWEAHRSLLTVPLFESQNTKNLSNAHH